MINVVYLDKIQVSIVTLVRVGLFLCIFQSYLFGTASEELWRSTQWEISTDTTHKASFLNDAAFVLFKGSKFDVEKSFSGDHSSYWLQCALVNTQETPIELGFTTGTHSNVKVYICDEDCTLAARMGELIKPQVKSIPDSEDYSRFKIPAKFNGKIRVRIFSYPQYGYRKMVPELMSTEELHQRIIKKSDLETKITIVYGFFLGALLCFLVIPINLFTHHLKRYYIYYALYVVWVLIALVIRVEIELDMDQTVSQYPVFFWKLDDISSLVSMIFYVCFFRSFIDTRNRFKNVDRALKYLLYALIVWSIAALVLNYGFNAVHWVYASGFIMRLSCVVVAVGCIYSLFRHGGRIYQYVAIGTLLMALGGVVTNLLRLLPGVLHEPYVMITDWNLLYWNGGVLLELIFFSLAMSYQFSKDAQEKRHALKQYVEQLKENQNLERKYNTELERQVVMRTEENVRISRELIEKEKQEFKLDFDRRLAEAELKALRSQMNPHFIFNSLNSIKLLIQKGEDEEAMDYLVQFSKLMRIALNNVSSKQVSLEEELDFCKRYLDIESLRFSDDFNYSLEIDPRIDMSYIRIPPLVIQPYIENALWHGLLHKDGNRTLKIVGDYINEESCVIRVIDNGIGREASAELNKSRTYKRKSLGQQLVQERIHLNKELNNKDIHVDMVDLYEGQIPAGTQVNIHIHPVE